MKAGTFRIICFCFVSMIVALIIALDVACGIFADTLTLYLSSTVALDDGLRTEGEALALQIAEEGVVMVKNDNDCLPLDKQITEVNVLGWASTQWIMGGSGSGRTVQYGSITGGTLTPETDLLTALTDYGVQYNSKLIEMYVRFQGSRPFWTDGALGSHDYEFCRLYEPSVSDKTYYSSSVIGSAERFSDTAIVVLGRVAGESLDCPKVQYKKKGSGGIVTDETRTYLDVSTEEEELLAWAGSTFENVVVIINSTNPLNLGFLDYIEGLDACLIVGGTGNNAAAAVPEILYGDVSPSGRTADTYVYDFATSPSFANAGADGVSQYANADEGSLYPNFVANVNVGDNSESFPGVSYIDYAEGIYVGYKWYETAYNDGFWESDFAYEYFGVTSYDEVVQYPFGYGLSYSEFEWEVLSVSPKNRSALNKDDVIKIEVKVTNTGNCAAQDVVELYYTAPYYEGGIEKSAISLGAFAKTDKLEVGQSQTLTLTLKASDMASYDEGLKVEGGGYILEKSGNNNYYTIQLMTDAHTVKDCKNAVTEYSVASDIVYDTDPVTDMPVGNLFGSDSSDGIALDGSDSGGNILYLTRSDFASTFPLEKSETREMSESLKESNLFTEEDATQAMYYDGAPAETVSRADNGNFLILYDSDGKVNDIGLKYGNPDNYYNDEMWDALLDRLSTKEMRDLVLHAHRQEAELPSIGKPTTSSAYGPSQIGSFNSNDSGVAYPNATVLAQSWNKGLAEMFGLAVGKEAGNMKYSGWYAPSANIHRSPFGGRNFEYYSEDSLLTGEMCAAAVKGAANAGIYCYIKSFAAYGQETYRDGLYCWMSEQTLREIYLSPFKRAIDGGATGIMTSYNRIGAVWTGGSRALISDLLRGEWAFKGAVITEYADHNEYINADQMLLAGGDLWMSGWNNDGDFLYYDKSYDDNPIFINALRTASKRVIYTGLNAAYNNSVYNASEGIEPIIKEGTKSFVWWAWLLAAINVVAASSCAFWVYYAVKRKDAPKATEI